MTCYFSSVFFHLRSGVVFHLRSGDCPINMESHDASVMVAPTNIKDLGLPASEEAQLLSEQKELEERSLAIRLNHIRHQQSSPPPRTIYDLCSRSDIDELVRRVAAVTAAGGSLNCIVLSVEPSQARGLNYGFNTAHLASAMQVVFHEVRDTPSELVFLDLARIDAVLPKSQAVLPYPKAERIVQDILFDSSSKEHIQCKANMETLNATNIKYTVMSAMAAKFMQRKQDVRHPGWFRHMDINSSSTQQQGLMLNQSNLALLRQFGVEERLLLPAAVKHKLLHSGIASCSPGTSQYAHFNSQPPQPDAFIQSGLLEGMGSLVNMAGYTRPQLQRGQEVVATQRRKSSEVYKSLGLEESPCTTANMAAYRKSPLLKIQQLQSKQRARDAHTANGLTTYGTKRKISGHGHVVVKNENPCCLKCDVNESVKWYEGHTMCSKCTGAIAYQARKKVGTNQCKKRCKKAHKMPQ